MSRPLAGPIATTDVCAALKAIGRFGAQPERLGSGANVLRFEIRAFEQNIGGVQIDLAVLAAHHPGQGDGFRFVGNQKHLVGERVFLAVERLEFFASGGAADNDGGAWSVRRVFCGSKQKSFVGWGGVFPWPSTVLNFSPPVARRTMMEERGA